MSDLGKMLIEQGGLWGVMCVALAAALLYKEREVQRVRLEAAADTKALRGQLDQEHQARLADAKDNGRALLEIAEQTHVALDKLATLAPRQQR